MNIIDIYTDSPNGFEITSKAPTVSRDADRDRQRSAEKLIKYYLEQLETYYPIKYPLEYGIINYALGKFLFNDKEVKKDIAVNANTERSKRIENSLFYFSQALEIFTSKDYPIMYSLINIYMGKLFKERSLLTLPRSFLSDRSTPEESVAYGIDHLLEALEILTKSRSHQVELACCCVELGNLYLLQGESPENGEDLILKEQCLTYLERTLSITENLSDNQLFIGAKGKKSYWRPDEPSSFPSHILDFLDGIPDFGFLEGVAYYLLGRLEAGWGSIELTANAENRENDKDSTNKQGILSKRQERLSRANPHHLLAFDHFNRCVSYNNRYLKSSHPLWSDAHHRVALLIIKHPVVVDPDFADPSILKTTLSDIYLDSAISHLQLALKCPKLEKTAITDIHFHTAQTFISKLQLIIDRVPYGESITKSIIQSDGVELISSIDHHLKEALSRVTAANTQSSQDAYLYFFSCLKLAEYRMLEAG
jgi:hypothetical protein